MAGSPPQLRRAASSRFSMLLEGSVDYAAYRQAYRRKLLLEQQPRFDSLADAEDELRCVLHDEAFAQAHSDGAAAAENAALAVDWFASALAGLFSGDEPFENPDFLRLCCMFFASPLYENNARLVQRHLVKRTYAELNVGLGEAYEPSLWLLLAFLHLTTEFQTDTFLLCKDSGLFPLLQRLVLADPDKYLHVLAMSLMFEVAQAVELSQTDRACITDALLCFLLDYIERMRYAASDMYNNTATKLVLALNEQLSAPVDRLTDLHSPLARSIGDSQTLALLAGSAQQSFHRRPRRSRGMSDTASVQTISPLAANAPQLLSRPPSACSDCEVARIHHTRASSVGQDTDTPCAHNGCDARLARAPRPRQPQALSPAAIALTADARGLPRSQSMVFQTELREQAAAEQQRPGSEVYGSAHAGPTGAPGVAASDTGTAGEPETGRSPRMIAILAQRANCCKTFTENLVFLLNRETDPATLKLILHMLACILANPDTSGILYTNDMHVLTDIVIRDLSNLSDAEQRLRRSYLHVVCVLLRNPVYLAGRHRLSDIELCLVNLLRQSLVSSQAVLVPVGSGSPRRGSMSDSSTRHNSMLVDPAAGTSLGAAGVRLGGGTASPAPSMTSTSSEETCVRASLDEPRAAAPVLKVSRRAPPPPPPLHSRTQTAALASSLAQASLQPRRRRAPPPPPSRPCASTASGANAPTPQLSPVAESPHPDTTSLPPTRRRAPPPPSPQSGTLSEQAEQPLRRQPPPPLPPPRSRPASRNQQRPPEPQAPTRSLAAGTPPPPPPPREKGRRQRPEQTGIRRQLSVRKSVSRYKRNSIMIQSRKPAPPLPPLRTNGSGDASEAADIATSGAVSSLPVAEASGGAPAESAAPAAENEEDDDDDIVTPLPTPDAENSALERRATRKLVANALHGCHEARALALSVGPAASLHR